MSLLEIIQVPYLPILGPVHPEEISDTLLEQLYASSIQNLVLPYDKSQRWYKEPIERIYKDGIIRNKDGVTIRTTTPRGDRWYIYGNHHTSAEMKGMIIRFSPVPRATIDGELCTVIFMDTYKEVNSVKNTQILHAHEVTQSQVQQIKAMGDHASQQGFTMLVDTGRVTSRDEPTLVYLKDKKVAGAIGPLSILRDSRGILRVLPCYFGVDMTKERQGIGSLLWQAVRQWGVEHNAQYKVLQAEQGSPAEHFYRSQKMQCLGYVYKKPVLKQG